LTARVVAHSTVAFRSTVGASMVSVTLVLAHQRISRNMYVSFLATMYSA
jgi:hypothetical protein